MSTMQFAFLYAYTHVNNTESIQFLIKLSHAPSESILLS